MSLLSFHLVLLSGQNDQFWSSVDFILINNFNFIHIFLHISWIVMIFDAGLMWRISHCVIFPFPQK